MAGSAEACPPTIPCLPMEDMRHLMCGPGVAAVTWRLHYGKGCLWILNSAQRWVNSTSLLLS